MTVDVFFQTNIDAEVKKLVALKTDYKTLTGKDWKPGASTPPAPAAAASTTSTNSMASSNDTGLAAIDSAEAVALREKVDAQGAKVRDLKTQGGSKVSHRTGTTHTVISISRCPEA